MWLFSDFHYDFWSSRLTADLLTVVSDRTAKPFIRSGANRAAALDMSRSFDRVWHAGLPHKLKSWGMLGLVFDHISSSLCWSSWRVRSKTYTFPSILPLVPWWWHLCYCYLCSWYSFLLHCDQASDLWQQIGLTSFFLFLTAIWLPHGQLWAIIEGTASLTRC